MEAAVAVAGTAAAAARVVPSAAAREAASREAAAAATEEVLVAAEAAVMAGVAAEAMKLAVAPAAVAAVGREVASWGLAELAELVATEAVAVEAVAALADWASLSSPGSTVHPAGPLRRFCHDLEWSNSTARLFRLAPNGLLRASPRDWCHRARPCPCERPPGHAPRRALSADPSCFEPCSGRPSN